MKKTILTISAVAILFSSCGTYAGAGAYTGANIGSILGSAIGGISGGPRGSDVGTIVGLVGGAAVGAAIGSAADQKEREEIYEYNDAYYNGNYSASQARSYVPKTYDDSYEGAKKYNQDIDIVNLRFVDANMDNTLKAGEDGKIIFEVYNRSSQPLYDVCPLVVETTENKHITVSPGVHVERLEPGKGIRYTAMVKADKRLKDGTAHFRVSAIQGANLVTSRVSEFDIVTRR